MNDFQEFFLLVLTVTSVNSLSLFGDSSKFLSLISDFTGSSNLIAFITFEKN